MLFSPKLMSLVPPSRSTKAPAPQHVIDTHRDVTSVTRQVTGITQRDIVTNTSWPNAAVTPHVTDTQHDAIIGVTERDASCAFTD